jgi:hypothetical protein
MNRAFVEESSLLSGAFYYIHIYLRTTYNKDHAGILHRQERSDSSQSIHPILISDLCIQDEVKKDEREMDIVEDLVSLVWPDSVVWYGAAEMIRIKNSVGNLVELLDFD